MSVLTYEYKTYKYLMQVAVVEALDGSVDLQTGVRVKVKHQQLFWSQMMKLYKFGTHDLGSRWICYPFDEILNRFLFSVTRSDDLLDFGQLLKPQATIDLPKSLIFLGNF